MRLNIANANYLAAKKDVVARYMKAYRETVGYMYNDPDGLKTYAEWLNISLDEGQAHARRVLPAARDRARHHRRPRHHREGCGDAEVHRGAS